MQLLDFNTTQFHVRTAVIDGEPVFIAKDVCDALEIRNSRQALARLDEDEKGVTNSDTLGGSQKLQYVNEAGLYALTLKSRKPAARQFRKWVLGEVLPALRKRGFYVDPESPVFGSRREGALFNRQMERLAAAQRAACQPVADGWGTIATLLAQLGVRLPPEPAKRLALFRATRRASAELSLPPVRRWSVKAGGARCFYNIAAVEAAFKAEFPRVPRQMRLFPAKR